MRRFPHRPIWISKKFYPVRITLQPGVAFYIRACVRTVMKTLAIYVHILSKRLSSLVRIPTGFKEHIMMMLRNHTIVTLLHLGLSCIAAPSIAAHNLVSKVSSYPLARASNTSGRREPSSPLCLTQIIGYIGSRRTCSSSISADV